MSPRVRTASGIQQQSFEEWYRLHAPFFADHPLFSIYKTLHPFGVDLNFLEFLRDLLARLDSLADNWSRPAPLSSSTVQRQKNTSLKLSASEHQSYPGLAGMLSDAEDEYEEDVMRESIETRGLGMKELRQRRIKIMEELLASSEPVLEPYSNVLLKYSLENQTYITGAYPDGRGTLILTMLVENFRLTMGRNKGRRRRPLWYEAGILLDGFRNQENKEHRPVVRDRTESRVKKFRRSNPEWQVEARLIIMKFYGIGE
jgi:hypothetical protein